MTYVANGMRVMAYLLGRAIAPLKQWRRFELLSYDLHDHSDKLYDTEEHSNRWYIPLGGGKREEGKEEEEKREREREREMRRERERERERK